MRSEKSSPSPPPSPTPTRPSGTFIEAARRAQLVAAAVGVLARSGYRAASLARIAAEAGVSKGVILYHFDGKEELLRAVVDEVSAVAEAYMLESIDAAAGPAGRLEAYIRSNLRFMAERPEALAALLEVIVHAPPPNPYGAMHARALAWLGDLVARGQAAGDFGPADPHVFATAVRAAIDAVPALRAADPTLDLARHGDELARLFRKAVAP